MSWGIIRNTQFCHHKYWLVLFYFGPGHHKFTVHLLKQLRCGVRKSISHIWVSWRFMSSWIVGNVVSGVFIAWPKYIFCLYCFNFDKSMSLPKTTWTQYGSSTQIQICHGTTRFDVNFKMCLIVSFSDLFFFPLPIYSLWCRLLMAFVPPWKHFLLSDYQVLYRYRIIDYWASATVYFPRGQVLAYLQYKWLEVDVARFINKMQYELNDRENRSVFFLACNCWFPSEAYIQCKCEVTLSSWQLLSPAELQLIPCHGLSTLEYRRPLCLRKYVASSWSSKGPNGIEWDICLYEYYIFFLQSNAKLLNRTHSGKQSGWGSYVGIANSVLLGPFFSFRCKKRPLHELERCKAWWNSALLATAQADSSVCRSNRWPWSWVARKLVIKYFNSDWFGNLRFIKSRVKSFVIQMARCLISPYYFGW